MKSSWITVSLLFAGCLDTGADAEGDDRDDSFLGAGKADADGITEGSAAALGVLKVANQESLATLDDDVRLDRRAATGIVTYRLGADQIAGTADDRQFATLAELDAIPYVGPTAFDKLLAFARAHGHVDPPRLDVAIDRQAIITELATANLISVELAAAGDFSGPVNLTAAAVDAAGVPIPGWAVTLDRPTVDLATNGRATVIATLTIPSENRGLAATVKIDAGSSLGTKQVTSSVTAANRITFPITLDGNGMCVYPAAGTVNVTIGTRVSFLNRSSSDISIHVNSNANGILHQSVASPPNASYEQTMIGSPGSPFAWYCHSPGPTVGDRLLRAVARPSS